MIQTNTPIVVNLSPGCKVAISFILNLHQIDPRIASPHTYETHQTVTTCIVRLLKGPKSTYAGVAIQSTDDRYDEHIARAYSLARALWQIFPDFHWKQVYAMARFTLWNIEKEIATAGTVLEDTVASTAGTTVAV